MKIEPLSKKTHIRTFELWAYQPTPADAFVPKEDRYLIELRCTVSENFVKKIKRAEDATLFLKEKSKKLFTGVNFEGIDPKHIKVEYQIQNMDGRLWVSMIFHCSTKRSGEKLYSDLRKLF